MGGGFSPPSPAFAGALALTFPLERGKELLILFVHADAEALVDASLAFMADYMNDTDLAGVGDMRAAVRL